MRAKSYLQSVRFRTSNLGFLNLAESKLENVSCKDCDLHEASLSQLRLKRLTLTGCNLTRAELFLTRLSGVDLSGNDLAGIRFSDRFTERSGARIEEGQAIDLVGLLGREGHRGRIGNTDARSLSLNDKNSPVSRAQSSSRLKEHTPAP